jgi:hypothetical protein
MRAGAVTVLNFSLYATAVPARMTRRAAAIKFVDCSAATKSLVLGRHAHVDARVRSCSKSIVTSMAESLEQAGQMFHLHRDFFRVYAPKRPMAEILTCTRVLQLLKIWLHLRRWSASQTAYSSGPQKQISNVIPGGIAGFDGRLLTVSRLAVPHVRGRASRKPAGAVQPPDPSTLGQNHRSSGLQSPWSRRLGSQPAAFSEVPGYMRNDLSLQFSSRLRRMALLAGRPG